MFPAPFEYCVPATVDEVVAILAEHRDEAKVLAGGQSLVPLMKMRLARPALVVDINRIPGLSSVQNSGAVVTIGPLVRHQDVRADPVLGRHFPWMSEVVHLIGDRQVRSLGTVVGSLVEADPTGDWSAVLLALDAEVGVLGPGGGRRVRLQDWFSYSFTPAIEDDEFVTEVSVRVPSGSARGSYQKLEKRAGDFAVTGCAVVAEHDGGGRLVSVRVGLTGVGPVPMYSPEASAILLASGGTPEAIRSAAEVITETIAPIADMRGSVEYKRRVTAAVFQRVATAVLTGDGAK